MPLFTAVVLVCQLSTTPTAACDENTAIDVMSRSVKSELQCVSGWGEAIAGTALEARSRQGLLRQNAVPPEQEAPHQTASQ